MAEAPPEPVFTPAPPPEPPPPPEEEEGLPLAAHPIERCAALAASLARRPGERAAILAEHALVEARSAALRDHWAEAIRQEARRGRTALLEAYDQAYVARLEEERGPITAEEYARLVVAGERGSADEALAALSLPRGALMRLNRVWLGRLADDAALAARVSAAVEAQREA
jgi:hypothetical protein